METIVVRLLPNHPTGKRNRAGFTFTETPVSIEVTEEQLVAIQNDTCLKIITAGTAYEQGLNNPVGWKGNEVLSDSDEEDSLTVKEIIAKLEEKGLVKDVDFNPRAKKDILLQLLNA